MGFIGSDFGNSEYMIESYRKRNWILIERYIEGDMVTIYISDKTILTYLVINNSKDIFISDKL